MYFAFYSVAFGNVCCVTYVVSKLKFDLPFHFPKGGFKATSFYVTWKAMTLRKGALATIYHDQQDPGTWQFWQFLWKRGTIKHVYNIICWWSHWNSSETFQNILRRSKIFWNILRHFEMFWNLLKHSPNIQCSGSILQGSRTSEKWQERRKTSRLTLLKNTKTGKGQQESVWILFVADTSHKCAYIAM